MEISEGQHAVLVWWWWLQAGQHAAVNSMARDSV